MALLTARVQQLSAGVTDAKMLVVSRDEAGVADAATDFIFDFSNPANFAAGALPATNAPLPEAGIVNLGRATSALLAGIERGAVTATLLTGAAPVFDGKGLIFSPAAAGTLVVAKAGVSISRVCQPWSEGFVSYLDLAWIRRTGAGAFFATNVGSFGSYLLGGSLHGVETNTHYATIAAGELTMVGKIVRFDIGAGSSTIQSMLGRGGEVTLGTAFAGRPIAQYPEPPGHAGALIGSQDAAPGTTFDGKLYRLSRHYIGRSGLTDDELLARFSREYAYGQARFA